MSFSIDGCRRSLWIILAVFCARWVILHRWVSPFPVLSLQMPEVNSGCPALVGVAVPGVIFAEMTGANSGCPALVGVAILVGHPPSGGVAMYGGLSLQMPEVNSDCFPLVGVAVLVVILHRDVSPCSMGYPCRCQKSTAAVCCARWIILASGGVAMYGGLSLQMPEVNSDCPPLVGVAVLDGSSLLSVVLYGSSLHRWVSLFSMDHPCCLLRSMGHPCRCQKSIATVFH